MSLDAPAIVALGEDMQKSDATPSFILKALGQLRGGFKPTEDVLRTTKIGVVVSKFRQHKDPEVQRQSGSLVKAWRTAIQDDKKKGRVGPGSNGTPTTTSSGAATPLARATASPAPPPSASPVKNRVPPEKRDANTDGVHTDKTGDRVRDGCLKLMYNGLAFMSEEPSSTIFEVALAVEAAAWTHLPPGQEGASPAYKEKMRSLFQNLKNKSNPNLRVRVLMGDIRPERFVRMTGDELKSPERRAEDEQMEKENMDKAMVAKEEKSISASLVCSKCRQKRVSYSQAQTRSADEPMTTFCECTNPNCGHRWKFS